MKRFIMMIVCGLLAKFLYAEGHTIIWTIGNFLADHWFHETDAIYFVFILIIPYMLVDVALLAISFGIFCRAVRKLCIGSHLFD